MHVEEPHHAPTTLREFLRQYAMIVLSILTALTLEHVAVSMQDRAAAAASRARIEDELAGNAQDLKQSEQTDQQNNKLVVALLRTVTDELKAGKPLDATAQAQMTEVFSHFQVAVPSFQRSAWESAIADQSASHLAPADLRRYAAIYAAMADADATWPLLLGGEWLTHSAELLLDYRLGKVDQRNLANVLVRFLFASQQITANEKAISDLIAEPQSPN